MVYLVLLVVLSKGYQAPQGAVRTHVHVEGGREAAGATIASRITSSLAEDDVFLCNVTNGTCNPVVCAEPYQTRCVWPGGEANATFLDAANQTIGSVIIQTPSLCTITAEVDGDCVNVTTNGTNATVYGEVVISPGLPDLVQYPIYDVYRDVSYLCGLEPYGRYNVWARVGTISGCRASFITEGSPNMNKPVITSIPDPSTPTAAAFFFRIPNQTELIERVYVEFTDHTTGLLYSTVYGETLIVRTVQFGIPGVVHRSFIVNGLGGPVLPNTNFTARVAAANSTGALASPLSDPFFLTTLSSKQSAPLAPTVSIINDTHVRVVPAPVREYGNTSHTLVIEFDDEPNTIEDRVLQNISCPGLCPNGTVVQRGENALFVYTVVVNEFGASANGVVGLVPPVPAAADGGGSLAPSAIAGIVIGVVVTLMIVFAMGYHAATKDKETYVRPTIDPEIEIDRGNLQMGSKLAEGSTAHVYLGQHNGTDGMVAIKQMKTGLEKVQVDGFYSEIRILGALSHKNIVVFVGAVASTDPVMIVTRYCEGGDLCSYVRKLSVDPLPQTTMLWVQQMIDSVRYIHDKNIIHRDIACRNYLLDYGFVNVRLCDFGMALKLDSDEKHYQAKTARPLASRWTAPDCYDTEQFSFGTDIWSLCISLHELYSNCSLPYNHIESNDDVIARVTGGYRLPIPERMPEEISTPVKRVYGSKLMKDVTVHVFDMVPIVKTRGGVSSTI